MSPYKIGQAYIFYTHHWHIRLIDGPLCRQHATENVVLILDSAFILSTNGSYDITLRLMVLPIRVFTEIEIGPVIA